MIVTTSPLSWDFQIHRCGPATSVGRRVLRHRIFTSRYFLGSPDRFPLRSDSGNFSGERRRTRGNMQRQFFTRGIANPLRVTFDKQRSRFLDGQQRSGYWRECPSRADGSHTNKRTARVMACHARISFGYDEISKRKDVGGFVATIQQGYAETDASEEFQWFYLTRVRRVLAPADERKRYRTNRTCHAGKICRNSANEFDWNASLNSLRKRQSSLGHEKNDSRRKL